MLQTPLSDPVFPEPILSSSHVLQHIVDFAVAKRLPSVVCEDSVLYVCRKLARLVSILLDVTSVTKCSH